MERSLPLILAQVRGVLSLSPQLQSFVAEVEGCPEVFEEIDSQKTIIEPVPEHCGLQTWHIFSATASEASKDIHGLRFLRIENW